MELWDESLYSSDEAMEFFNFFHKLMLKIVGKDVEIITYEEFKDLFIKFGKSIAKNYCEEYYEKDNLQIVIEDLKKISGMYLNNRNLIVINEKDVSKIYYEYDLEGLISLFHELYHYKVQVDIKKGIVNDEIAKCIKEGLLDNLSRNSDNINSFKTKGAYCELQNSNNYYYTDNYRNYFEECLANISAYKTIKVFLILVAKINNYPMGSIEKAKEELDNTYDGKILEAEQLYENRIKNFVHTTLPINSYYADFDEIFDCFIKDNKKWLEYEIISLEYVLDKETGKVRKRTIEELYTLKENSKYSDYIELLINKMNSKNVSRSM